MTAPAWARQAGKLACSSPVWLANVVLSEPSGSRNSGYLENRRGGLGIQNMDGYIEREIEREIK